MIPLSWTCLAWRGRTFWLDVLAILTARGYQPLKASRAAVLSAIAAAQERERDE